MIDMRDKLQRLHQKNYEFGWEQSVENGICPEEILMIDKKTKRKTSTKMRDLYGFAICWKEAFHGADLINPNELDKFYSTSFIKNSIELISENYKPLPPCDPSDWNRTALMAAEDGGRGVAYCFYWWRNDKDVEPCLVYVSGGNTNIFIDMDEFIDFFLDGAFPRMGDEVYKQLEDQRGTLGG